MGTRTASIIAAAAAGGLAACLAPPALAQGSRSLSDMLHRQPGCGPPPVARFVVDQGPSFVFDRSNPTPLIRFENRDEIFVLQARPTGRGEIVYLNDAGEVVLKISRLCGITVFSDDRPQGAPVALRGGAAPLPTGIILSPAAVIRRMNEVYERIDRVVPHVNFKYSTDDVTAPLVGEAARITADVIEEAARGKRRSEIVSKLERVVIQDGPAPSVSMGRGVLTVTVAPGMGIAGRPSSKKIARALR